MKKAILIIDDDLAILESVKFQVQETFGNEFLYEMAESGEEGLEVVEELAREGYQILVTISDWKMDGMNGDEFLIELHKIIPNSLKIMLTGHASKEAIDRAYKKANLYKVIQKPWSEETLIKTIKDGLAQMKGPK
jgi:DNA-binding NtrC family response regulator